MDSALYVLVGMLMIWLLRPFKRSLWMAWRLQVGLSRPLQAMTTHPLHLFGEQTGTAPNRDEDILRSALCMLLSSESLTRTVVVTRNQKNGFV